MNRIFAYPHPALTDGVVLLRPFGEGDLRCVEEASQTPEIPWWTSVPVIYSEHEGRAFIERVQSRVARDEGVALAIADAESGEALGLINLTERADAQSAGMGYWLIERARGARRATRAVTLLSRWALTETVIERVEALVEPENVASARTVEAAGFQREGRLRSYLGNGGRRFDVDVYSLISTDLAG